MNCKEFNKNLLEYTELESSGVINHEMQEHIDACHRCKTIYTEKLNLKDSFNELINLPSKNFTPQNNIILQKLDNNHYNKSMSSKIVYHFKRNKIIYTAGITFAALLIFALPVINSHAILPHSISKADSKKGAAVTKNTYLARENTIIKYDIKNKNFDGELLVIPNPTKIAVGYSLEGSQATKTTREIAKSYGAVAAINGGATLIDAKDTEVHAGIIIHDGKVVYNDLKDENIPYNAIAFNGDGQLIIGEHTLAQLKELDIKEGIVVNKSPYTYGTPLIAKGKSISSNLNADRNPRTAIGQKGDGSVLFLVTNGREANRIGATLSEIQDILLNYGAVTAANLIGGSHSSMYYNETVIIKANDHPEPSIFMVMP